jgi:hypothetical protein
MKAMCQRLETCDSLWSVGFRLAVATGCLTLAAVVSSSAAYASYATEAMASPYALIGTVISTEKDDRIATVITDSGRQVKVLGTPDTSWFSKSYTSVDRRYAVAGRYEFHPINAESPYQDDICTATHQLAGPRLRPLEPTTDLLPAWLPTSKQVSWDISCSSAR